MDRDTSCRNTKDTDGEGIRLGSYVAAGLGKADPGGRGVENARACGGEEDWQVTHVQSGMGSSVAAQDWDYGSASGRCAASLASTVLQEMRHDADWKPAIHPVAPPVGGG
jgi:hypothetical protein